MKAELSPFTKCVTLLVLFPLVVIVQGYYAWSELWRTANR